jgi:putative cell wall-binding protein
MNDNLALEIIGEQEDGFVINNDHLAEWALKKISEEKAEMQRMINVCQTFINEYQMKIGNYQKQFESKTEYLTGQLQLYFETVPHKATKTQEIYKLPSGTLKKKYGTPEFIRDETVLSNYLKDNNMTDYYEEVAKPKWAELKKIITVSGEKVLTADGEIIEGVTAVPRPDTFEVEI